MTTTDTGAEAMLRALKGWAEDLREFAEVKKSRDPKGRLVLSRDDAELMLSNLQAAIGGIELLIAGRGGRLELSRNNPI